MNQFPDSSYNDIKNAVESYKKNNTWPKETTFTKESFDHLQDILIPYNSSLHTGFSEKLDCL